MKKVLWTMGLFLWWCTEGMSQDKFWEQTNGPNGGSITALAADSAGGVYALTDLGMYRTDDQGLHWTQVASSSGGFSQIVVSPNGTVFTIDTKRVIRSTDSGRSWDAVFTAYGSLPGLIMDERGHLTVVGNSYSQDNGNTWTQLGPGLRTDYLMTGYGYQYGFVGRYRYGFFQGMCRSLDYGETWEWCMHGLPQGRILSGVHNNDVGLFVSIADSGLYFSSNRGDSWAKASSALPDTVAFSRMLIHPNGDLIGVRRTDIYRSSDNGLHWQSYRVAENEMITSITTDIYGAMYVGTESNGIFVCEVFGDPWYQRNFGLVATTVYSLAQDHHGHLYAGTANGVFRSTDRGMEWEKRDGTPDSLREVRSIIAHPSGVLFATVGYEALYRSSNQGDSWENVYRGSRGLVMMTLDGSIFHWRNEGIYRSTDGGEHWTLFSETQGHVYRARDGTYYLSDRFLVRSSDDGRTWSEGYSWVRTSVTSIVENSKGDIIVGTSTHGLFRSSDHGENWIPMEVQMGFDTMKTNALVILPDDRMVVGLGGAETYVYTPQEDAWHPVDTSKQHGEILTLVDHRSGYLFAGTQGSGVLMSATKLTSVAFHETQPGESVRFDPVFPNPANPVTVFSFDIPHRDQVNLTVYSVLGQEVAKLVSSTMEAGKHEIVWNASNVSTGMYLAELETGNRRLIQKVVVIR